MRSQVQGATPEGPTQRRWFAEGYQAALVDILQARKEQGLDGVNQWLSNNMITTSKPADDREAI